MKEFLSMPFEAIALFALFLNAQFFNYEYQIRKIEHVPPE